MNIVILTGRLTKDPEVHTTQSGGKWVSYTLAVDRRDGNADFIRCKAFGKPAEWISNYLHKGTKINAEGRLQTGSYKDHDGKTVYTMDVITSQHEFCEPKNAPRSGQNDGGEENPASGSVDGFLSLTASDDEELPFK